jgi:glycine/D-amino acid oxidase-like deaminating enzyme
VPDVIVIGGGVVGTMTAWHLADAGASVTLLERGAIASGATGRSQGLVLPPDHAELVPLWRESIAVYTRLADEHGADFCFDREPIGTLLLATHTGQLASLEHAPVAGDLLDAAGVAAAEPALAEGVAGGLLIAEGRRTDPGALAASAAEAAEAAGARIRTHVEVKRIGAGGVVTDAGSMAADVVVLAAGAWSRRLGHAVGADVPVRPVRGWLALLVPGPPVLRHAVHEAGYEPVPDPRPAGAVSLERLASPGLAETGAESAHALGVHQNRDGSVSVGASRSAALHEWPESTAALRVNAARACRLVPALAGREVGTSWTGLRPFSEDGRPYIGRLDERTFVCAGHGSEGILTGGGSGRLVAELVLGREPFTDPAPFDPGRPRA